MSSVVALNLAWGSTEEYYHHHDGGNASKHTSGSRLPVRRCTDSVATRSAPDTPRSSPSCTCLMVSL